MTTKPLDVIAVGRGCMDLVVEVDRLPGHDEKVVGRLAGWLPGGTVPNFACAASRLGLRTGFLGTVGDDPHGASVRADFARWGVYTEHLLARSGADTFLTVVLVPPNGEKAVIVVPTDASPLALDDESRAYLCTAHVVYSMPYDTDQLRVIAAAVRAGGGKTAMDIETTPAAQGSGLAQVLHDTDIAFLNGEGLLAAFGTRDPRAARDLLKEGPEVVVVTLGAEGSHAFTRGGEASHPGFRVPVVDTTGAGDCYNAAFVRGYLAGWTLEQSVRFANAAAAISVTKLGPRGAIPTAGDVEYLMRAQD